MTHPLPRILVLSDKFDRNAIAKVRPFGPVEVIQDPSSAAILARIGSAEAVLLRTGSRITEAILEAAENLVVIGRAGVGLDNIDLDACRARGIVVVHTPGAATDAVADLSVGLMINLVRHLHRGDRAIREEAFALARHEFMGREIGSLTVGVVGFGRIGRAFAQRCQLGFGMRVLFNDIVEPSQVGFPVEPVSKERLFSDADIVSLHVPLTPQTRHLVSAEVLGGFRRGALLINTARGPVVDTDALVAGLEDGALSGAGLDVTDPEPLPAGHPLLGFPNVIVTPHIGARTCRAQERMSDVVDDVIRVMEGQEPLFPA